MKGLEPPQERDSRSYADQQDMKDANPKSRLKRRSKRGLVRRHRKGGR